jgi:hypothetical protein
VELVEEEEAERERDTVKRERGRETGGLQGCGTKQSLEGRIYIQRRAAKRQSWRACKFHDQTNQTDRVGQSRGIQHLLILRGTNPLWRIHSSSQEVVKATLVYVCCGAGRREAQAQ